MSTTPLITQSLFNWWVKHGFKFCQLSYLLFVLVNMKYWTVIYFIWKIIQSLVMYIHKPWYPSSSTEFIGNSGKFGCVLFGYADWRYFWPWFVGSYARVFDTLGMICKCCDGPGGDCTSRWNGSCSNLQCIPWRFHWLNCVLVHIHLSYFVICNADFRL